MATASRVQRLCSEIQLFDLCDLEYCNHKQGKYCTNPEALERFEAIQEEDDRSTQYLGEELEDEDVEDEAGFDEEYDGDEYEEE